MISALFFLACIAAYVVAYRTRALHRAPVLFLASAVVAGALILLGPTWEPAFRAGIAPFSYLLGPMTVALALPLAEASMSADAKAPLGFSLVLLLLSAVIGVVVIVLVARGFDASPLLKASLAPRAATTALSVPSSEALSGSPSLTSVVVATSGVLVALVGPRLLTILGVKNPTARGLALGAAGHLVATARAWEEGKEEGTASTFALVVHGVFTVGATFLAHVLRFF